LLYQLEQEMTLIMRASNRAEKLFIQVQQKLKHCT
jgi:hypothetical protein